MSIIIGIDVGAKGAIAFMDRASGDVLDVVDMPTDEVQIGASKTRLRVSDWRLLQILKGGAGAHAFIEIPAARPIFMRNKEIGTVEKRSPGAAGMLSFGMSYGITRCACTASGIILDEVQPGVWKRVLRVPAAKDDARRIAIQLYPTWAQTFARKKDDGRAEATLIARYGRFILDKTMT